MKEEKGMGLLAVLLRENSLYFSEEHLEEIYEKTRFMSHRGEKSNLYYDEQIALSHQSDSRLASQPFQFQDGRYTLVLDGSIYNIEEIREFLLEHNYVFETNMDTEVIAKLFLHKHTNSFAMLRGPFALLVWDQQVKTLYGARDPFGMKPLYYMRSDEETIFASEKKSTLFSSYEESMDNYAFHQYLDYKYAPEPHTLTKGIRKVKPGHYFIKELNNPISFHRYFHGDFRPKKEKQPNLTNHILDSLYESVHTHIKTNKQNGLYIEQNPYSFILGHVAKQVDPNIKAFSISYRNEDQSVNALAQLMDVDHHDQIVTAERFMEALPEIIWLLDDPFADLSAITNYFTAKLAKEHVPSIVFATGAEEVLGHFDGREHGRSLFSKIPKAINRAVRDIAPFRRKNTPDRLTDELKDLFKRQFTTSEKRHLLKRIVTEESMKHKLFRHVEDEHEVIQRQYIQLHNELPSNRLNYMEKLTVANDLELHLPFLDKRLFSVLRNIPVEQKKNNKLINHLLQTIVPKKSVHDFAKRKMRDANVPIQAWLRNECYFWAKQLIQESETDYVLDKEVVLKMLDRNMRSQAIDVGQLWTVLVFMVWHQVFVEDKYSYRLNEAAPQSLIIT